MGVSISLLGAYAVPCRSFVKECPCKLSDAISCILINIGSKFLQLHIWLLCVFLILFSWFGGSLKVLMIWAMIYISQAMYEGILVDLPFATFFLSKLKQKYSLSLPLFLCVHACMGVICFCFYYAVCVIHFFLLILACVYDLLLIYQVQFFKWSSFIGSRIISTSSVLKALQRW